MTGAGDPRRFDDLFQAFGPITIRRFFGGEGIYTSEVMIGMVFDDLVYLTTDKETRKPFVAEKCKPFKFTKRSTGEMVSTHWYAVPDRLYDDPDEVARWARAALTVATASPTAAKKARKASRLGKSR